MFVINAEEKAGVEKQLFDARYIHVCTRVQLQTTVSSLLALCLFALVPPHVAYLHMKQTLMLKLLYDLYIHVYTCM